MRRFTLFLLLLASGAAAEASDGSPLSGQQWAQLSIERRIIIRVPALVNRRAGPAPQPPVEWREKRAGRCIAMKDIAGAAITTRDGVDLILNNQSRIRAKLDGGCRAADFYLGFYMEPTADDRLCADRDMIHARSGAMCEIDEFRRLVPEK